MADVDQVVGDNSKPNKPPHSVRSSVAAATDPVTPFENADAAFTAGAPFLGFLKPPLFLLLFALRALGGSTGDRHPLHAHLLGLGFIGGREETRIGGGHLGSTPELLDMPLDGRSQQSCITGALIEYLVMRNDLIFGFLES